MEITFLFRVKYFLYRVKWFIFVDLRYNTIPKNIRNAFWLYRNFKVGESVCSDYNFKHLPITKIRYFDQEFVLEGGLIMYLNGYNDDDILKLKENHDWKHPTQKTMKEIMGYFYDQARYEHLEEDDESSS